LTRLATKGLKANDTACYLIIIEKAKVESLILVAINKTDNYI